MQTNKPLNVDDLPIIIRFYQSQNIKKAYRVTYRSKSGNEDFVGAKDKNEADKKVKEIEDSGHKIINVELLKAKVYVKTPQDAPQGTKIEEGPQGGHYYESDTHEQQTSPEKNKLSQLDVIQMVFNSKDPKILNQFIQYPDSYVREHIALKTDQEGLHKLINDKDNGVRYEVAQRIDQDGLHKMMKDISFGVRLIVTKRIDQSGLHEMINDSYGYVNPTLKTIIAERINIDGLKKIQNIEGWVSDYSIDSTIKRRIQLVELLEPTITHYNSSGEIVLDDRVIDSIRNIMIESSESTSIISLTDEFYNLINNGEFHEFHIKSKESWEKSSSSDLALLLKDSIKRQFGGEIRYHDEVKDIENKLSELYREFPQETVDRYIQIQKKLTKAYLDVMFPYREDIPIYRGTATKETKDIGDNNEVRIQSNPLSSWTLKQDVAVNFARRGKEHYGENRGIVLKMFVHKDDIWSTFMSHAYHGSEMEILLIGNKDRKALVSWRF